MDFWKQRRRNMHLLKDEDKPLKLLTLSYPLHLFYFMVEKSFKSLIFMFCRRTNQFWRVPNRVGQNILPTIFGWFRWADSLLWGQNLSWRKWSWNILWQQNHRAHRNFIRGYNCSAKEDSWHSLVVLWKCRLQTLQSYIHAVLAFAQPDAHHFR